MYVFEDAEDLENVRKRVVGILSNLETTSISVPVNLLMSQVFFDYGYITSRQLFGVLISLCDVKNEDGFRFIMTNPDPVNYFFKHFRWLPAASVSRNDSYETFASFVTKNPGESPADAIAYRADEIIMASDKFSFIVYGNRALELGTIVVPGLPIDFFDGSFAKYASILMDRNMVPAYLGGIGRKIDSSEIAQFGLKISG